MDAKEVYVEWEQRAKSFGFLNTMSYKEQMLSFAKYFANKECREKIDLALKNQHETVMVYSEEIDRLKKIIDNQKTN